jgi:HSP20 family protein
VTAAVSAGSIELPGEIDTAAVKAEYQNGVLKVVMPKSEAAKPKRIDVKVK